MRQSQGILRGVLLLQFLAPSFPGPALLVPNQASNFISIGKNLTTTLGLQGVDHVQ